MKKRGRPKKAKGQERETSKNKSIGSKERKGNKTTKEKLGGFRSK